MNNSVERIYEENKLSDVLKEIKLNLDYYNDSMNVFKNRLKVVSDEAIIFKPTRVKSLILNLI